MPCLATKSLILALVIVYCGHCGASNVLPDTTLTIPLNKSLTAQDRQLYGDFIYLNGTTTLQINFTDINVSKKLSFIIFQVHSHLYNVTVYKDVMVTGSYVTGTNVGLYSAIADLKTFNVYNPNKETTLKLYLSVHGYGTKDPIPGGCNMEFPVPTSPYLQVSFNQDYVLVDAAAPKNPGEVTCNSTKQLTFYRIYLPEGDYSESAYFDALLTMMTMDGIEDNGEIIPETGIMWSTRRMLAAYPGAGFIITAVAITDSGRSVYVPASTYACDPLGDDQCGLLDDVLSQLISAAILFAGAFICYFGHQYFKLEMFLVGLVSGALVTYIIIANIADLDRPALIGACLLSGVCFGAIWLIFWWMYGIPVAAVMLATLNVGFLVGAIMYYRLPGGIPYLESDLNFWTLFIFVMIGTSAIFASLTHLSNIVCCCVLGGYAVVYPIDYYMGSSLKYILINAARRAVVPKFNFAVVSPPFEMNDAVLTLLWVSLALTGFLVQHHRSRGRPPFPPPPRTIIPRVPSPDAVRFYGSLSRPASRSGSRPVSRAGSRTQFQFPQFLQSLHTANRRRSQERPLLAP